MSYENSAGLGVLNHYGVRDTQDTSLVGGGVIEGGGAARDYVLYFGGSEISANATDTALTLPAGCVIVGAVLEIVEAMDFFAATDDLAFGDSATAPGTNGVQFDNTDGVVGTYPAIYNGTFAIGSVLAADTLIASDYLGTGGASGGKGKVVFTVRKV